MTVRGIKPGTSYAACDHMSANSDRPMGFAYGGDREYSRKHVSSFGTKHFKPSEFTCHCCGEVHPDGMAPELFESLEELRDLLGGRPIKIMSGYRCPRHNSKVGGARNSQHLHGRAADVIVPACSPGSVADTAEVVEDFERGGIGRYQNFTHVDVRGFYGKRRARWGSNG